MSYGQNSLCNYIYILYNIDYIEYIIFYVNTYHKCFYHYNPLMRSFDQSSCVFKFVWGARQVLAMSRFCHLQVLAKSTLSRCCPALLGGVVRPYVVAALNCLPRVLIVGSLYNTGSVLQTGLLKCFMSLLVAGIHCWTPAHRTLRPALLQLLLPVMYWCPHLKSLFDAPFKLNIASRSPDKPCPQSLSHHCNGQVVAWRLASTSSAPELCRTSCVACQWVVPPMIFRAESWARVL